MDLLKTMSGIRDGRSVIRSLKNAGKAKEVELVLEKSRQGSSRG
jgi:hypothetical protein